MTSITERVLKDSFERSSPLSMDVTKVVVDTRAVTHDVVNVYVRTVMAGRLVTDKVDSVTLARRLLPDTLRYDKEPSSVMLDMQKIVTAYYDLLTEARVAVSTRNVANLAEHLRRGNDPSGLGVIPPEYAGGLLDREARREAATEEHAVSHAPPPSD